jgi:hypothetical protein
VTPKHAEKLKKKITDIKRILAAEKKRFGCHDDSVSKQKKTTSDNGQVTTLFSGSGNNNSAFRIKLILKKDETGDFAIYLPSNDRSLL